MSDTAILAAKGRRVWDSRGRPTVEADLHLAGGAVGRAIAPAGASMGTGEAVDLRDGGAAFGGLDVTRAVGAVNGEIAAALRGMDAADQQAVDLAGKRRSSGDRSLARLEPQRGHEFMEIGRHSAAGRMLVSVFFAAENGCNVGLAQAGRRFDERIEHRLQIEGRPADHLQHFRGCRLLLQRLGELFQLGRGCVPAADLRFRLRFARTKLATVHWAVRAFARQGHPRRHVDRPRLSGPPTL